MSTVAPYGSWKSPISLEMLTHAGVGLGLLLADGEDVYWTESRPLEAGRTALVKRSSDGTITDVGPPDFNARSRVHEYGGGAATAADGVVVASSFGDQRVYRLDGDGPVAITPEPPEPASVRYADHAIVGDHVISVRERHHPDDEAVNDLVAIPLDGSAKPKKIVGGHDFFSSPRVSPDRTQLAWLAWDHPNMPWDGTELWVGALTEEGRVSEPERIAGGPTESIFQPEWSPSGVLHYISDRSGWWNLYRHDLDDGDIYPLDADFGYPQWAFGMRRYAFMPDGSIVCIYDVEGRQHLARLSQGRLSRLPLGRDSFAPTIAVAGGRVWAVAGDGATPSAVMAIDAGGAVETVKPSSVLDFDPAYISRPEAIEFPTTGGATAHAFYYSPNNPDHGAPPDERPPLLVLSHGGPTGQTTSELDLGIQFWTSRGFAVVDVNYRGSTGFGRAYRDALKGNWGVVDTDDCVAAARYLAERGAADPDRMAIRGGSAGGYTTLCALTFRDDFAAGASYFGVGDLAALAEHTHKFESRYLDSMVGPYPEAEDVYRQRSPVLHPDELSCPVILLQGLDDRVVPPEQAEAMVAALDAKGIPHAYLAFEGEGHGFRKAENIERAREAELYFYSEVFDFDPADDLNPIDIAHEAAL